MKKLLLVLAVGLLGFTSVGQCKYKVNEIDKFTETHKVETKPKVIYGFLRGVTTTFAKYDNVIFMRVVVYGRSNIFSIHKGDGIIILCGDKKVNLSASDFEVAEGVYNTSTKSVIYSLEMEYLLTNEELIILQENEITEIRVYLSDSYIEHSVKSKKAIKIQEIANCI